MRRTALHWTIALTCFVGSAVVACTSEAPSDLASAAKAGVGQDTNDVVPGASKGGAGARGVETTATGLPCDVDKVLKSRCQTCHGSPTQFGASAPLVTRDDLIASGPGASGDKKVYELVASRIHDAARPMPPAPNPLLDAQTSRRSTNGSLPGRRPPPIRAPARSPPTA
jgi:hypothetical protein